MALVWTLKLNDAFSGPIKGAAKGAAAFKGEAKTAAASADSLAKALEKMRQAREKDARLSKLTEGATGKPSKLMASTAAPLGAIARVKASLSGFGAGISDRLSPILDRGRAAAERFGPGIKKAAGALGSFAAAAGVAVAASAALVDGLAIKGIGIVRDAQAFRESTLFAFEKITGSKQGAQDAFNLAGKTALSVGADFQQSMSGMNSLMAQGFDPKFADRLIKRMADLKTINPAANSEGIVRAITQIKTTGRLQGDELMQLAEAGLSVSDAYDEMAKSLGITSDKAGTASQKMQKLQAAGKITADTAIAGIEAAIKKKTGGGEAGDVAAKRADASIEGAIARAKALATMKLGETQVDWSPAVNGVKRLQAAFDSPAGARLMKSVGDGISKVVALADNFTAKDMSDGLDAASGAVTALSSGVVNAVNAVFRLKSSFDGAFGSGASIGALGTVFGALVAPLSMATAVVNALASAFSAVAGAAASAASASRSVSDSVGGGKAGGALTGALGAAGGGFFGGLATLAARAGGGPVEAGKGYMVGEEGPEYFRPRQSGTIVPNDELARANRAGESLGRSITNSSSSMTDARRTFAPVINMGNSDSDAGDAMVDRLRHLVQGYA